MSEPSRPLSPADEERLADYLAGRLEARERVEFEREILSRDDLSEELYGQIQIERGLSGMDFVQSGKTARAPRVVAGRAPWRRRLIRIALPVAAGLALVLIFGPGRDSALGPRPPVFRGGESAVEGYLPRGEIPTAPERFEWPATAGASRYRFELYDTQLQLVHRAVTETNAYELPPEIAGRDGATRGFWKAVPLLGATAVENAAPMIPFEVEPR